MVIPFLMHFLLGAVGKEQPGNNSPPDYKRGVFIKMEDYLHTCKKYRCCHRNLGGI